MRTAAVLGVGLCLLALVVSCSSVSPVPIKAGDICEGCRRPIQNVRIAAELLPPAGRLPMKFRTVSCMARYLHAHADPDSTVYVTDFQTGRLITARTAVFVKGEIDENTKEMDYFAFGDVRSAVAFVKANRGATSDWPSIQKQVAAVGTN